MSSIHQDHSGSLKKEVDKEVIRVEVNTVRVI